MHPLWTQIEAVELLSDRPVVAVGINHEGLSPEDIPLISSTIAREAAVPVCDVLLEGCGPIVDAILEAQSSQLEAVS
jgi:hypothetical protein